MRAMSTCRRGSILVTDPTVMLAAGGMYLVEFFTDKIPGVDTGWDALHTFIRIPAGALMAAGAAQGLDMGQTAELVSLLVGGGVATTSHAAKAGSRVLINTSPEPFSNWGASVAEDVSVVAGLWAALNHPWLFIVMLVVFLLIVAWLLPKIWRAIGRAGHAVRRWFGGDTEPDARAGAPSGRHAARGRPQGTLQRCRGRYRGGHRHDIAPDLPYRCRGALLAAAVWLLWPNRPADAGGHLQPARWPHAEQ